MAESLGIEPSRVLPLGTLAVCWLTICLALGKKWRVGDDSNAVDQVWNLIALPGAPTRKDLEEGGGIEPLCFTTPRFSGPVAGHSAAPSNVKDLVARERLELSLPKELVPKTSAYAFRHRAVERSLRIELRIPPLQGGPWPFRIER